MVVPEFNSHSSSPSEVLVAGIILSPGGGMALERELETYKSKLAELRAFEGKFVLIHGSDVVDVFTSYDDAIKEGYQKFGLQPFLVKQILSMEQIQFISRCVEPASALAL